MANSAAVLPAYIAGRTVNKLDPYLERHGLCHGMVIFSLPDLGILFRCRVGGSPIDLEFAALFSLLKFVELNLSDHKPETLHIFSSNPEFVFSFLSGTHHLAKGSARELLLREYLGKITLQVSFIAPSANKCLAGASEFPSLPQGQTPPLRPTPLSDSKPSFKPFQRGTDL